MEKVKMKRLVMTFWLSTLLLLTTPLTADALDIHWVGVTGDWSTGANWDSGEPASGDHAYINNGGTAEITGSGEAALDLTLGESNGESGNVIMTSGDLTMFNDEYIGWEGTGTFKQTGGVNYITNSLHIDYEPGGRHIRVERHREPVGRL